MSGSVKAALLLGAGVLSAATFVSPASADIELSRRGSVVYLSSHRLMPGDAMQFEQFLEQSPGARIVYLDSKGGNTQVAIRIGRMIRERGLDTGYHVGRGRCVSACTTMFLGGVNRYYVGSRTVSDGVGTRRGLGFHPSNGGFAGEQSIAEYYNEMGVPGAAALRYHVYPRESVGPGMGPRRLYFTGGHSALRAGVATSTSPPRDSRLRD